MTALQEFRFLETLLWAPATLIPSIISNNQDAGHLLVDTSSGPSLLLFWQLHLDRLSKSLSQLPVSLGLGTLPQEAVQQTTDSARVALLAHVASKASGLERHVMAKDQLCLRLRLLVDLNGQPTVESTPIPLPPTLAWSVPVCPLTSSLSPPASLITQWWTETTRSISPVTMYLDLAHPTSALDQPTLSPFPHDFVLHKTTHRPIYDSAQLHVKRTLHLDSATWVDVLLHSSTGLVTESCIANVAILSPDTLQWITPRIDLDRGTALLPGCLRAVLLQAKVVVEGNVPLSWITERGMPVVGFNSVRGCFPVHVTVVGTS